MGCSPRNHEKLDRTERLPFHFSLSCIGEGNGIPLLCSCLENPRDWGAWWAAVYGVTKSQTRLKQLSSSKAGSMFCGTLPGTGNIDVHCGNLPWHPTPVLWPGKSHGWRSLVGYSPWGREESDMTERLPFQFSLSCIGEGNGNPLQCSCLEDPRDGGAWWAAVYGVAESQT